MIDRDQYYFEWGNGLVGFNSLSPNYKYFYQIKKPEDMYWGLFVAKIAFYSVSRELIYFNKTYADPIHAIKTRGIKYASYSSDGNQAYFRERETLNSLYNIILNLEDGTYKRVKWLKGDNNRKLEIGGFNNDDLSIFDNSNWQKAEKANKFNKNIFGKKLWYP